MSGWDYAVVISGGVATLAIFSFLYKENPFYRFFEHLFIGIAAGFGIVGVLKDTLYPFVVVPLFGLDIVHYPDGSSSQAYEPLNLLFLIPLSFGMLYYFIYSRTHSWLAKLVIGFTLGVSGGMAFDGFFTEMTPQIIKSMKPLIVFDPTSHEFDLAKSFQNAFFIFTLLSVMFYFFFSFRFEKVSQGAKRICSSGRLLMMVCFGAFFGSTVMARMALLVERLQFLYGDWWSAVRALIVG